MNPSRTLLLLACAAFAVGMAAAQQTTEQLQNPKAADVQVVAHVVEPEGLEPTPERLAALQMPDGFELAVFADSLVNPRMLAVADDGTVYVTRRALGDVIMLKDENGDGAG